MARRQLVRTPLHRQVAEQLRQDVLRRQKPGDRLPSEASLATQFQVSLVTVREALSALAQEGLLERRHGSGTYVSELSATRHLAIVSEMDLGSSRAPYFQLRVVHRLTAALQAAGWPVRLYLGRIEPGANAASASTANGLGEALAARQIAGIAAVAALPGTDLLMRAEAAHLPIVGDDPGFAHAICTDMVEHLRQGLRRLAEAGRRRIAVQLWDDPACSGGYAAVVGRELAALGLALRPGWIVSDLHPQLPGSGHQGFGRIWEAEAEKPDGLLIADDHYFPEAAMAIAGRGLAVPGQLQVVSFANAGSGMFSPFPVETLVIDPDRVAEAGAAMLLQLVRGEQPAQRQVRVAAAWGRLPA